MTHKEDIKRLNIMNKDYLHNRIEALENKIQTLQRELNISKQLNLKQL
jgi:hypothetical protein